MSIEIPNTIQAMCTVTAGGASFLAGSKAPGFTSVTNAGTGLNDFLTDVEVAPTQCVMLATPRSATDNVSCQTVATDNAHKRVRTYIGGVLSDVVAFDFTIFRMPSL